MPWKTVTHDTVLAFSRDARIEDAWDADSDAERDGWFAIQRDSTVASIRVKCSAGGANPLDPDPGTIPPEFVELAALRLLIAVLSRMGPTAGSGGEGGADPLGLTADQKTRLTQLEKDLEAVSQGKLGITPPTDGEPVTSPGAATRLVSNSPRLATRNSLAGL